MRQAPPRVVSACTPLVNVLGLHARATVKLMHLARELGGVVEIALSADGPWVNATSPSRVMRVGARYGSLLHVRASGDDAGTAVDAIIALVSDGFGERTLSVAVAGV